MSDRNDVFRSFSFFNQVVYSIASIERYLQVPPRITSCRLTQIAIEAPSSQRPDPVSVIVAAFENMPHVTIHVEDQQMNLNYSTNIVQAFQKELNLLLTL